MKLRAYAPALVAVAAIVVVYLATREHDANEVASRHAATPQHPTTPGATPALPMPTTMPTTKPAPKPLSPEDTAAHMPRPKKGEITLDEKLAETKKHITVIERRAALLEQEIVELEAAGKQKEAAEQRIVLKRLRAHADELRATVAEGRDPL